MLVRLGGPGGMLLFPVSLRRVPVGLGFGFGGLRGDWEEGERAGMVKIDLG